MQTPSGMLARTIHDDRLREYDDPAWRHAATARASGPTRTPSILRSFAGHLAGRTASGRSVKAHDPASAEAGA